MEIRGTYNTAKVFTDNIEFEAIEQIKTICNLDAYKNCKIRIMPDVHSGVGCTIGTTISLDGKVTPNIVGVDIGCALLVTSIKEKEIDFEKLDNVIKTQIPSGKNIREKAILTNLNFKELNCYKNINEDRAIHSIGTLGGGNHFIELDKDDEGNIYIVIHTGSRHLGLEVCNFYQEESFKNRSENTKDLVHNLVEKLKKEKREKEIESEIKKLRSSQVNGLGVDRNLSWCEGNLFCDYIEDMKFTQNFACINREKILETILEAMNFTLIDKFITMHNYINTDDMILRKGAVSAKLNEKIIIPLNMRDGSLICIGKGNEDWNYSAPHGAGRIMSRGQAKRTLNLEEFKDSMKDVYTTTVNESTIDEAPMVYKNMDEIINNIQDTVFIEKIIKPIYNFKASE